MKNFEKKLVSFLSKYLSNYDFVYLTTDLRGFIKTNPGVRLEMLCEIILNSFIQKKITVIVPTYNYITKKKFIVEKNNSNLSFFTKWFLRKKIKRSEHPIFSVGAYGPKSNIVNNIGKSAFGYDSIFERLLRYNTSIFHLGRPFHYGNTIIHYVEQNVGATYRHNKLVMTSVFKKNKFIGNNYTIFARVGKLNAKKFITNSKKIDKILKNKNILKQIGLEKNLTNFTHFNFKKAYHIMCKSFYSDKNIFLKTR